MADELFDFRSGTLLGSSVTLGADVISSQCFDVSFTSPESIGGESFFSDASLSWDFPATSAAAILEDLDAFPPFAVECDTWGSDPNREGLAATRSGSACKDDIDLAPHGVPAGKPQDLAARLKALVHTKCAPGQASADTASVPAGSSGLDGNATPRMAVSASRKRDSSHADFLPQVKRRVQNRRAFGSGGGSAERPLAAAPVGASDVQTGAREGTGVSFGSGISICVPFGAAITGHSRPGKGSLPESGVSVGGAGSWKLPAPASQKVARPWTQLSSFHPAVRGPGLDPPFRESTPWAESERPLRILAGAGCQATGTFGERSDSWRLSALGRTSSQVAEQDEWRMDSASALMQSRLVALAEAISAKDMVLARFLELLLREEARVDGTPMQRLACCLLTGLQARMAGRPFQSIMAKLPQQALDSCLADFSQRTPYITVTAQAAMEMILEAVVGEPAVHIVDMGTWAWLGTWLSFLQLWAAGLRGKADKAYLRLTIVEMPTGGDVRYDMDKVGRELRSLAASLGVGLMYEVVQVPPQCFQLELLQVDPREALAVSCFMKLGEVADAANAASSSRDRLLQMLHALQPRVLVITEPECESNVEELAPRVRGLVEVYYWVYDSLDALYPRTCPSRKLVEQHILAEDLINALVCDGKDRWMVTERFGKWQARLQRAGFTQLLPSVRTVSRLQNMTRRYPEQFRLELSKGAVELCWKSHASLITSAWQPWA